MKKGKLFIALLMAVLMLSATFAAMPVVAADDSSPVVFSWDNTVATTPEAWTAWQNWAKQFYPDIVNFDPPKWAGGWTQYVNKVVLSPTTKERWDAVPCPVSRFIGEWGQAGTIRPVADLLTKANANNLKKLVADNPILAKRWSYNGKLSGIPYPAWTPQDQQAFVWRTDVLKKCGFTSPPKTIASLESFCAKVKKYYPTMIPIGMSYGQFETDIDTTVAGVTNWYTERKNGMNCGVKFSEQFALPAILEINKFYKNGWLSADQNVAYQKTGNIGLLQDFVAGKSAVTVVKYGDAVAWGDAILTIRKAHPSWNPIVVKDNFSGPKGSGRMRQTNPTTEFGVVFSPTDIGNEAAQIRMVKYLDWMWNPKNLWFYIPQMLGAQGWYTSYTIDQKANKVQLGKTTGKTGFGKFAGSMGMWFADDWTRVEKIPSNASAAVKLGISIRALTAQAPKNFVKNVYVPEMALPTSLTDKYPTANTVMWGTGTFDKLCMDTTRSTTQITQAYRDWCEQIDKTGGYILMNETFKAMKAYMGNDFAELEPILNKEK